SSPRKRGEQDNPASSANSALPPFTGGAAGRLRGGATATPLDRAPPQRQPKARLLHLHVTEIVPLRQLAEQRDDGGHRGVVAALGGAGGLHGVDLLGRHGGAQQQLLVGEIRAQPAAQLGDARHG